MKAGAQFGFVNAVLFVALDALRMPSAWALFWTIQALFLMIYTILTWQRTRMIWMTVVGAYGALISVAFMLLSVAGYGVRDVVSSWPIAFWGNAAAIIVMQLIAKCLDRDRYRRWKQHTQPMTVLDLLRFRHIPNLREPV